MGDELDPRRNPLWVREGREWLDYSVEAATENDVIVDEGDDGKPALLPLVSVHRALIADPVAYDAFCRMLGRCTRILTAQADSEGVSIRHLMARAVKPEDEEPADG